jgi:hypothetical protein
MFSVQLKIIQRLLKSKQNFLEKERKIASKNILTFDSTSFYLRQNKEVLFDEVAEPQSDTSGII